MFFPLLCCSTNTGTGSERCHNNYSKQTAPTAPSLAKSLLGKRRWKTPLALGKASIGSLATGDGIIGREGGGGWRLWGGGVEEGREKDGDYGAKLSRKGGRRITERRGMGHEQREEDECRGRCDWAAV
uniref:Uncharacterized protein n=1 Tax=Oryza glumipatula TaxID=40148 RepID=A0A0D9Y7F1_9ORYZ